MNAHLPYNNTDSLSQYQGCTNLQKKIRAPPQNSRYKKGNKKSMFHIEDPQMSGANSQHLTFWHRSFSFKF